VLDDDPLGSGCRIEIRQRLEPVDTGRPVTGTPAPVGILEVIRERACGALGKAERTQAVVRVQAETSGRGLTMPTPCSRFVDTIVRARATIACETSLFGSASTIGSPSSA
jgi:hypothetical protein